MSGLLRKYKDNYISIIRLGLPILIGQLGMIIVGFADNIMVGQYSTEALASASFVNNIFNVAILACIGFTYGLTPLIGALFSQERYNNIGAILRNGLFLNTAFSLIILGIMTILYFNVDKMGQPVELLPLIRPYYLLYLAGLIPISVFNVFAQWAYAINRTKMPMWIILVANIVNVIGNYMLIYGVWGCPELGLTGAGISTLFSRVLSMVCILVVFFGFKDYRKYRDGFTQNHISRLHLRQINRTSWPVALQMAFETGAFSLSAIMAGWLGKIPLASFQVMLIVGTLGFCIYYSFAASVSVLVSNAAGLNDNAKIRRISFAGFHILLAIATISSLVFIVFGETLIRAFTDDTAVIITSLSLIFPLVLYQYGDATQINFANALRGTSNVMPMLWIAFVSYIVVGLPSTYLLAFTFEMGLYGIFLSFSVSLFLAAALFIYFFMRTTRQK
ncbi:MAG: MATE family efflux transporter [Muribaculaceae bacterium]|nr:MATE family efflux transporter [Muribaculaceae bacterium]